MKKVLATAILTISSSILLFGCSDTSEKSSTDSGNDQASAKKEAIHLDEVSNDYREYALSEVDEFVKETENFTNAIKDGNLDLAKKLYAPARMHYERSEPIAEVFGDLDPKIDAREGDVPEKEWTGYHRIEQELWVDKTTKGSVKYAEQLMKDATLLRAKVETVEVTPDLLITGAVDLLNEVSTSKVTGEEDRYSHTDLYDFVANVQGAEKIYQLLKPALKEKDEQLSAEVQAQFDKVFQLLDKQKQGDGYKLYTDLTKDEVKQLSQAIDALAEPLSQIGIVVEES
ncbi:iron uptake system protein EfeO [Cytobacillus sp. Hz8]|uniref:iron uptake system protein EfeO n=1 Tax=Cytobacillus sp. Hz8 TaxID=3347168 RepID=UPI0035DE76DA